MLNEINEMWKKTLLFSKMVGIFKLYLKMTCEICQVILHFSLFKEGINRKCLSFSHYKQMSSEVQKRYLLADNAVT